MPVTKFDNIADFARDLPDNYELSSSLDLDWRGGKTYKECLEILRTGKGDDDLLEKSATLLDKVEGDGIQVEQNYWDTGRTGPFPCVPAYLSGSPDSMLSLQIVRTETAPIRVYLDLFISCGYSADDVMTRGITLLALCRKLSAIRPVELYLLMSCRKDSERDGWISPMIKIEASPLDLRAASFVIGHPGFVRNLTFAWCRKYGADNSIPFFEYAKARIKPGKDDLFIENAIFTRDVLDNPLEWVNQQVTRFASDADREQDSEPDYAPESSESKSSEPSPGDKVKIEGCRKSKITDRARYNGKTGEVVRKIVTSFKGKSLTKYLVKFSDGSSCDFIPSTMRKA